MWINRLERKFGKYAINDLPIIMAFTYLVGYLLSRFGNLYEYFIFDPYLIIHKFQVWRLFSWIFCVGDSESNVLFLAITVFFYYSIARILSNAWGAFRFNVYIFSGLFITLIGSFLVYGIIILLFKATGDYDLLFGILGVDDNIGHMIVIASVDEKDLFSIISRYVGISVSTYYIYMSILLAFAATYPDMQVLLYFIIPIKIKWLGIVYSAFLIFSLIMANWVERFIVVLSLLNFIIFFISTRKKSSFSRAEYKRRSEYQKKIKKARQETANRYEGGAKHKCCICGRTDVDSPELTFRYCSKCTGGKEYCNEHLFTHIHK